MDPSIYCWNVSALKLFSEALTGQRSMYRGADKSLARPGRKQANVSVHNFLFIPQYHCNLSEDIQQSWLTVTINGM